MASKDERDFKLVIKTGESETEEYILTIGELKTLVFFGTGLSKSIEIFKVASIVEKFNKGASEFILKNYKISTFFDTCFVKVTFPDHKTSLHIINRLHGSLKASNDEYKPYPSVLCCPKKLAKDLIPKRQNERKDFHNKIKLLLSLQKKDQKIIKEELWIQWKSYFEQRENRETKTKKDHNYNKQYDPENQILVVIANTGEVGGSVVMETPSDRVKHERKLVQSPIDLSKKQFEIWYDQHFPSLGSEE